MQEELAGAQVLFSHGTASLVQDVHWTTASLVPSFYGIGRMSLNNLFLSQSIFQTEGKQFTQHWREKNYFIPTTIYQTGKFQTVLCAYVHIIKKTPRVSLIIVSIK